MVMMIKTLDRWCGYISYLLFYANPIHSLTSFDGGDNVDLSYVAPGTL